MATPYVTIVHDEVSSTQDVAISALAEHTSAVVIVANRQTAGRGRFGNEWWQAPRGIAASLAFSNETLEVDATFGLTVGLAVRAAIKSVTNLDVRLKWPNDVTTEAGKVGGILVQRAAQVTVAGCGLNLWWPEPPPGAAGLCEHDPGPDLGLRISEHWARLVLTGGQSWDREAYRMACATLGNEVTWEPRGRGRAVDIDEAGGLVVESARGLTTVRSGEVHTIRSA
ncbi:MAG: biotin--[acetyl-CoA-carboxylase] ligase [Acidimicrobiia bacterium]|nr:biotin--[acetyl-CoA-carboxylase] ligase [Acidimicrobiia bacterium]